MASVHQTNRVNTRWHENRVSLGLSRIALPAILLVILQTAQQASGREAAGNGDASSHKLSFSRDIRPILADKCFKCHGPDAKQRKGKLRLDSARDATAPAASGSSAIVPGKLDDSELYERITADDPDERMPPAKTRQDALAGRDRPAQDLDRGRGRVPRALGVRAASPARAAAGQEPGWCRNPIDFFILARLEAEGLAPSPEADRVTLIRRAQPRPDRPAALDRGGRCVPRRSAGATPTTRLVDRLLDFARITASAGDGSGSMPPAMPTPTATRKTSRARSTSTATGSSAP